MASLVVRADSDEEAERHVLETFSHVPDIKIISIEEASEEVVSDAKAQQAAVSQSEKVTLN